MSQRGLDRERRVRDLLSEWGWVAIRAAKGPVDVVANVADAEARHPLAPGHPVFIVRGCLFVQVKTTASAAYDSFLPSERAILSTMAAKAGAEAWLCWWPPNRPPVWIPESSWPKPRAIVNAGRAATFEW